MTVAMAGPPRQSKQGHVWQVFSSRWNSKMQGSGNKVQVKTNGLENGPAILNGNCGPDISTNYNLNHS